MYVKMDKWEHFFGHRIDADLPQIHVTRIKDPAFPDPEDDIIYAYDDLDQDQLISVTDRMDNVTSFTHFPGSFVIDKLNAPSGVDVITNESIFLVGGSHLTIINEMEVIAWASKTT